jgi:hypothetical protein
MLFKEIIGVNIEEHKKPSNTKCKCYWMLRQVGYIVTTGIQTYVLNDYAFPHTYV